MKARLQEWIETLSEDPRRLLYLLALGFIAFYLFRGCIPGFDRDRIPTGVLDELNRTHVDCVGIDELEIRPGDHRQPECGQIIVEMVAEGNVPAGEAESGVSRAVCFQVKISNPRWTTMAQTRHEIVSFEYRLSKVAVLQNGTWQTFPDEDREDERRWLDYSCPGEYREE